MSILPSGKNSFFNLSDPTFNQNEQDLLAGLADESIGMYGTEFNYLPMTLDKEDSLFHESVLQSFNTAHKVTFYVESFDGFEGDDALEAFGFTMTDTLVIKCATTRFQSITGMNRPNEGDLIQFAQNGAIFEIKFAEEESNFYALGSLPFFEVKCERWQYSGETLNTGIAAIDAIEPAVTADDKFSDNASYETATSALISFDEQNPFGSIQG